MSDFFRTQSLPYQNILMTAPPGECVDVGWSEENQQATSHAGIPVLPQSLTGFLPLLDYETTGSPGQTTSLAPSSQCTTPRSSFPGVKRHMRSTARGHPYEIGHHSKSKASAGRVQGVLHEMSLSSNFARPGGDSLEYAQGLVFHPSSWGSRSGGEFGASQSFARV